MARVKGAMMTRKRRNKILKMAKGYWGAKSKHFKMANQAGHEVPDATPMRAASRRSATSASCGSPGSAPPAR